jgi:hypothetical protein
MNGIMNMNEENVISNKRSVNGGKRIIERNGKINGKKYHLVYIYVYTMC